MRNADLLQDFLVYRFKKDFSEFEEEADVFLFVSAFFEQSEEQFALVIFGVLLPAGEQTDEPAIELRGVAVLPHLG